MTKPSDDEIERAMPAILAQAGEQARANSAISAEIIRNRIAEELARAKAANPGRPRRPQLLIKNNLD